MYVRGENEKELLKNKVKKHIIAGVGWLWYHLQSKNERRKLKKEKENAYFLMCFRETCSTQLMAFQKIKRTKKKHTHETLHKVNEILTF